MKRRVAKALASSILVTAGSAGCSQAKPDTLAHFGTCDASAAVAIDATTFLAASDEDNVLRAYRQDESGAPVQTFDLNSFLRPDSNSPETDLEGATRIGDRVYWISSHGTNKNGKQRPSRHRLFATDVRIVDGKVIVTPVGTFYRNLVRDLIAHPDLADCRFAVAATKPPEEIGALNIEGLAATPQGALWIGFRNPIPDGKALLVPIENPAEVVEGKPVKLGKSIRLPLGGLGIRSMEYYESLKAYLIVAGPSDNSGRPRLYRWSGAAADAPVQVEAVDFAGTNPEALVVPAGNARSGATEATRAATATTRVQVLSDDGTKKVSGVECKQAPAPERCFRSFWITP